jgi:hypothetical protein
MLKEGDRCYLGFHMSSLKAWTEMFFWIFSKKK